MKTIPDLINALEETRLSDCDKSVLKKLLATMKEPEPPIELKSGQVWQVDGDEVAIFRTTTNMTEKWTAFYTQNSKAADAGRISAGWINNGTTREVLALFRECSNLCLVGTAELVVKYSEAKGV